MNDTELAQVARELAKKMFQDVGATATLDSSDLKAAVSMVDTIMNATTNQVATQESGVKLELAFNNRFPEPFKSVASLQQKAMVIALWALRRGGLI